MSEQTKKEYELDDLEVEDVTGGAGYANVNYKCQNCGNEVTLHMYVYNPRRLASIHPARCDCGNDSWNVIDWKYDK